MDEGSFKGIILRIRDSITKLLRNILIIGTLGGIAGHTAGKYTQDTYRDLLNFDPDSKTRTTVIEKKEEPAKAVKSEIQEPTTSTETPIEAVITH